MNVRPSIARPRKRNAGRPAEKSAPGFLQFIRGRACLFEGIGPCEGKIQAAHLDFAGDKGVGTKCSDRFAIPLCAGHHAEQHCRGWDTVLRDAGLSKNNLLDAAAFLWSRWPGRAAWERKLAE
jgi:hypothetical protein